MWKFVELANVASYYEANRKSKALVLSWKLHNFEKKISMNWQQISMSVIKPNISQISSPTKWANYTHLTYITVFIIDHK